MHLVCTLFYELFFPLEGPEKPPGGIPRKMGKITKFASPVRPPKMGKITEKLQILYFRSNFSPFLGQFSPLSGGRAGREI